MSDTDSAGYGAGRKPVEEPSSPPIASLAENSAETLKTEAARVVGGVQDRRRDSLRKTNTMAPGTRRASHALCVGPPTSCKRLHRSWPAIHTTLQQALIPRYRRPLRGSAD
jgi:hypothetical protein